jgi:transcriptional regulator with XRE-family HTH domain
MTVDELAQAAKVGRATITRIENGKTGSSNAETVKRLASALKCRPEDLFTPPADDKGQSNAVEREPVDFEMSSAAQNAVHLVAMRYGESPDTILELAPLLFDLFAKESLQERRRRLSELESHRAAIAGLRSSFPHIGERIVNDWDAEDIERLEEASIQKNDLRASYIMELGAADHGFVPSDYDEDSMNPFVTYLQERLLMVSGGENTPSIDFLSPWGSALYDVGIKEALQITGGDEDLAGCIIMGQIPLTQMPKGLRGADAHEARLEWMREQKAANQARWTAMFADLDIEVNI